MVTSTLRTRTKAAPMPRSRLATTGPGLGRHLPVPHPHAACHPLLCTKLLCAGSAAGRQLQVGGWGVFVHAVPALLAIMLRLPGLHSGSTSGCPATALLSLSCRPLQLARLGEEPGRRALQRLVDVRRRQRAAAGRSAGPRSRWAGAAGVFGNSCRCGSVQTVVLVVMQAGLSCLRAVASHGLLDLHPHDRLQYPTVAQLPPPPAGDCGEPAAGEEGSWPLGPVHNRSSVPSVDAFNPGAAAGRHTAVLPRVLQMHTDAPVRAPHATCQPVGIVLHYQPPTGIMLHNYPTRQHRPAKTTHSHRPRPLHRRCPAMQSAPASLCCGSPSWMPAPVAQAPTAAR